jgi:hypothetical protein
MFGLSTKSGEEHRLCHLVEHAPPNGGVQSTEHERCHSEGEDTAFGYLKIVKKVE